MTQFPKKHCWAILTIKCMTTEIEAPCENHFKIAALTQWRITVLLLFLRSSHQFSKRNCWNDKITEATPKNEYICLYANSSERWNWPTHFISQPSVFWYHLLWRKQYDLRWLNLTVNYVFVVSEMSSVNSYSTMHYPIKNFIRKCFMKIYPGQIKISKWWFCRRRNTK